jgi:hypothetical protein
LCDRAHGAHSNRQAAYFDIEPVLAAVAAALGKPAAALRLWDPFYCAGSCVHHLRAAGFPEVCRGSWTHVTRYRI